jgi:hypothetical protein
MKQLDSSIKRNAALVKKLQKLTEESCGSLLDEIAKVNQSKVRSFNLVPTIWSCTIGRYMCQGLKIVVLKH